MHRGVLPAVQPFGELALDVLPQRLPLLFATPYILPLEERHFEAHFLFEESQQWYRVCFHARTIARLGPGRRLVSRQKKGGYRARSRSPLGLHKQRIASRTPPCANVSTMGRRSETPALAVDGVLPRRKRTLRPEPPRRSQTENPMSLRPSSGPAPKCSSASASFPRCSLETGSVSFEQGVAVFLRTAMVDKRSLHAARREAVC